MPSYCFTKYLVMVTTSCETRRFNVYLIIDVSNETSSATVMHRFFFFSEFVCERLKFCLQKRLCLVLFSHIKSTSVKKDLRDLVVFPLTRLKEKTVDYE